MVNGWLRLPFAAAGSAKTSAFRRDGRVNQQQPTLQGCAEVVLARAILGLLVNLTAALAAGN
jgi:hypothetical protein